MLRLLTSCPTPLTLWILAGGRNATAWADFPLHIYAQALTFQMFFHYFFFFFKLPVNAIAASHLDVGNLRTKIE